MMNIKCLAAWLLILLAHNAFSAPLKPEQAPEPLKPWINWVLQDSPAYACPFVYNNFEFKRCSWPTQLNLDLNTGNGRFKIAWRIYQDSWITLPGSPEHWPLNVTANNKALMVMEKQGKPVIKLAAGYYQISGEFLWDKLPENLEIPGDAGLIALRINGADIGTPTIRNSQLWLRPNNGQPVKSENTEAKLDIQVYRKIIDDVPMQILTRLELEASGRQREVRLPAALPEGSIPLKLLSDLPARIEPDGRLVLQLRPGHWQLDILSRYAGETNSIKSNPHASDWPESEIWVFEAKPSLRLVEVERALAIDPSQTNLPGDWQNLPAYKLSAGQTLQLKIIRRGDPEPEPNQLDLERQLWLDFSGAAYTVQDHISGKMTRDWRLNALPQTRLGRVALDGSDQLITVGVEQEHDARRPAEETQGVEVRKGRIELQADSRIEGDINTLSVTGWEQNFNSVRTELNLPPGWRLLAAQGVDNVPDTWISKWTLLDLFMVLIAALAVNRLWSPAWGGITLITLSLIWYEPESPHFIWLNILAATALVKAWPENNPFLKYIQVYQNLCRLALALIVIPFMVTQFRIGLYPQLEQPFRQISPPDEAAAAISPAVQQAAGGVNNLKAQQLAAPKLAMEPSADYLIKQPMYSVVLPKSIALESTENFVNIDPNAHIQTGPGLPQWQWQKISLDWNGGVDKNQQLRLWILPPVMNLLLSFMRVMLVVALTLLMFGASLKQFKKRKAAAPLLAWLLVLPLLGFHNRDSHADFPDQELLNSLKSKLLEAPDCAPGCAQIQEMRVKLDGKELSISLQIHAQQAIAAPLPSEVEQWLPSQVLIDGENAVALYRDPHNLWIYLEPGVHQIILSGSAPNLNKFILTMPLPPRHSLFDAKDWRIDGVREDGQVDTQLQFTRMAGAQAGHENTSGARDNVSQSLPAFVQITRTLQLGLDWRVSTHISRLSPLDAPIVLNIPLLAGEAVTSPGIRVKDNQVQVNMSAGQSEVQWQSLLEKSAAINLQAADNTQWSEIWRTDISPIWHVALSGIPMMHLNSSEHWLAEWHPWPGEKLALNISRPKSVSGANLTIDSSKVSISPGQHNTDVHLSFNLRSSLGGQHSITLPEQAELQTVKIDGYERPLRLEGRSLTLPIRPGKQAIAVDWRQTAGVSLFTGTPPIDLHIPSVNSSLNIGLGDDRWVLLTQGPMFGPAVLFWGILLVIALVAFGLSAMPFTPLKYRHWFLLLLGLSQINILSAGLVVGWLTLLGWRAKITGFKPYSFNLLQLLIAAATVLALYLLFSAVEKGLLGAPDMQIVGNDSTAFNLNWYQDRSLPTLPAAGVISLPLTFYRLLMLAWSLWLAISLLDWLKWGWSCFTGNGLWRKSEKKAPPKNIAQHAAETEIPGD